MKEINARFTDNDDNCSNTEDVYHLSKNLFKFRIQPKTIYWTVGLRFFDIMDLSSDFADEKEIIFESGRKTAIDWSKPGELNFSTINFNGIGELERNRLSYKPLGIIDCTIGYLIQKKALYVSLSPEGGNTVSHVFQLPEHFSTFSISANAEDMPFDLMFQIETHPLEDIDVLANPFLYDGLTFRFGEQFDHSIFSNSDLLVLPVATKGQKHIDLQRKLAQIGIPKPSGSPRSAIEIYKNENGEKDILIAYAYLATVQEDNLKRMEEVFKEVSDLIEISPEIRRINLPLLGLGSGGLRPSLLLDIYNRYFGKFAGERRITISSNYADTFSEFRSKLSSQYLPLPAEDGTDVPGDVEKIQIRMNIRLDESSYQTDLSGNLIELTLTNKGIVPIDLIAGFIHLSHLNLSGCHLMNLNFLTGLHQLTSLNLNYCEVFDFSHLAHLPQIEILELSQTGFRHFELLKNLKNLYFLRLRDNGLTDIRDLAHCDALNTLDLSSNRISDVSALSSLKSLINLFLSRNKIHSLSFLPKLKALAVLDVSENMIAEAKEVLRSVSLTRLHIDKNPVIYRYDISLDEADNHLVSIKNYLQRREEKNKVQLDFPVKIVLMGNHASGKSTLLHYLQTGTLDKKQNSTHIISIEPYPQKTKSRFSNAIFFDFGGQDYYHGIYRAFLSGGSIYILLWQNKTDFNQIRMDSNGFATQDFSVDYWLSQKQYLEQQVYDSTDPILLVQTHAERDQRRSSDNLYHYPTINNEFYLSLAQSSIADKSSTSHRKNHFALEYLRESINELIGKHRSSQKEPSWYVEFMDYIIKQGKLDGHISRSVKNDILPNYKDDEDDLPFLMDTLDQLHKKGIIIYYKKDLPDQVWLNPSALVNYIHKEILTPELLAKSQNGCIGPDRIDDLDPHVITMLVRQKVIFYHQADDTYIIPNFLRLAGDSPEFNMMTFGLGNPLFVMKFKNFLPFGFINQVICSFGTLPQKKVFWRDQLLFTLEDKAKILIKIDFQNLEVKVFSHFFYPASTDKNDVIRYLFYGLLCVYWNLPILSYREYGLFDSQMINSEIIDPEDELHSKYANAEDLINNSSCRPLDLYLSLNNQDFISYNELCSVGNELYIPSEKIDQEHKLHRSPTNTAIYPFQPFVKRKLKRQKKAVISYSKKDIAMVEDFKKYLVPLSDDGLIQAPWYCTELIAGSPWDETIQEKFNDADIIFFMISENLMSTSYVKDHEIKNAIDRWNAKRDIFIVPIILVPYHWARQGEYDLSRFTALPYTGMPISSFKDKHLAWDYVSEAIKIMIQSSLYPGTENFEQSNDMKGFFKKVMKMRNKG